MKSKSKSKLSKLSNNKFIKIMLITLVIGLSIYLLYFNDKIFIQDPTSLNVVENFDVAKYVDICKTRKTNFYNFDSPNTEFFHEYDLSNCELKCDETNCHAFIMRDISKCFTYKGTLDSSGIDRNNVSVEVNCESTILPRDQGTYNGYGYINKKYFEDNKSKFTYKDVYLEESNKFIDKLKTMNSKYDDLYNGRNNYTQKVNAINAEGTSMGSWIANFGNLIGFDSANLFTINNNDLFDLNYNVDEDPKQIKLKEVYNASQKIATLEYKENDINKRGLSKHLFYIILAFIMVITIILLVLYKFSNNVISDGFMIFYFIVIVTLFAFIQYVF